MIVCELQGIWLFVAPSAVAHQTPLSMGILQARILERLTISSSRQSSWPRGGTRVSCIPFIGRWVLYYWYHLGNPFSGYIICHFAGMPSPGASAWWSEVEHKALESSRKHPQSSWKNVFMKLVPMAKKVGDHYNVGDSGELYIMMVSF